MVLVYYEPLTKPLKMALFLKKKKKMKTIENKINEIIEIFEQNDLPSPIDLHSPEVFYWFIEKEKKHYIANLLFELGDYFFTNNDYDNAYNVFTKAIFIFKNSEIPLNILEKYLSIYFYSLKKIRFCLKCFNKNNKQIIIFYNIEINKIRNIIKKQYKTFIFSEKMKNNVQTNFPFLKNSYY